MLPVGLQDQAPNYFARLFFPMDSFTFTFSLWFQRDWGQARGGPFCTLLT